MSDQLLVETAERVFADTCTHAAVQAAEVAGWPDDIWAAAAAAGFPWISVPEEAGGSGGTVADALAVLRVAGRHAAPIPLAETGLLAGWLLAGAGLAVGEGPMTVVPGRPSDSLRLEGGRLSGTATRVPWAAAAEHIVALVEAGGRPTVVSVAPREARIDAGTNLAGEPRDTVVFDHASVEAAPAPTDVDADALRLRGALSRVALMAGALERMSELTVGYTNERRQFGRPVAQFQAVQQHLVAGAQDAALVAMAADVAAREADRGPAGFEIAAAKLVANQAALTATRSAHQAHGAMGMTQEYPLHHLSRRLWAWRAEYGDDRFWAGRLGRPLAAVGADQLYPALTGGSAVVAV